MYNIYIISDEITGECYGRFRASNRGEALDKMVQEAGCKNYNDAAIAPEAVAHIKIRKLSVFQGGIQ